MQDDFKNYQTMPITFFTFGIIKIVGTRAETVLFFRFINEFILKAFPCPDLSMITDQFYRCYIDLDRAPKAVEQMQFIESTCATIDPGAVDWTAVGYDPDVISFDLGKASCRDVFARFFEHFYGSHQESMDLYSGKSLRPRYVELRIRRAKLPFLMIDGSRPLAAYDALEGDPFWLRPDETTIPNPPSYKSGKIVPDGTPGSIKPDFLSPDANQAFFIHKLEPDQ